MTNYLKALTMELTALARACGKSDVHNLEPEDLVALTDRGRGDGQGPAGGHRLDPRDGGRPGMNMRSRRNLLTKGPGSAGVSRSS